MSARLHAQHPGRYQVLEMGLVVLETGSLAKALAAAAETNDAGGDWGDGCASVYDTHADQWVRS